MQSLGSTFFNCQNLERTLEYKALYKTMIKKKCHFICKQIQSFMHRHISLFKLNIFIALSSWFVNVTQCHLSFTFCCLFHINRVDNFSLKVYFTWNLKMWSRKVHLHQTSISQFLNRGRSFSQKKMLLVTIVIVGRLLPGPCLPSSFASAFAVDVMTCEGTNTPSN